ncbi:MAG: hypothetical protein K0R24_1129 [Gammaproteobacteria bacterium]|jgi:hypothetical protein|nr:hypothetical protein [Gammaproteobacteria bacterium]
MDGKKEEKKSIEPMIASHNTPSPNNSDTSFYQWLASKSALSVIESMTGNEEQEDISDLRQDSNLKEDVLRVPSHRKRKSEGILEAGHSYSRKQTPPASPKLPSRRPNNGSPLLFPRGIGENLDSLPCEILLNSDDSLSPCEQELLDALLKKLKGKPTHLLIAEKAIAQQRMREEQPNRPEL